MEHPTDVRRKTMMYQLAKEFQTDFDIKYQLKQTSAFFDFNSTVAQTFWEELEKLTFEDLEALYFTRIEQK